MKKQLEILQLLFNYQHSELKELVRPFLHFYNFVLVKLLSELLKYFLLYQ
jgi:hypothetical protein